VAVQSLTELCFRKLAPGEHLQCSQVRVIGHLVTLCNSEL
jgi:hypothetical protein